MNYEKQIMIFKALSDNNRLQILKMLSNDELCACKILEELNITQPTLSHHMKVLSDANLVFNRKDRNWTYYTLNIQSFNEIKNFIRDIANNE